MMNVDILSVVAPIVIRPSDMAPKKVAKRYFLLNFLQKMSLQFEAFVATILSLEIK